MDEQEIPKPTQPEGGQTDHSEPTLKEKTAKGFFWGGLNNGIQVILQLVYGIIMMNLLDATDYGIIGMLAIFSAIALVIQDSGFSTALVNQKEIRHQDYNAVFWFSVLSSTLIYITLYFSAPLIADFYKQPVLTLIARVQFLTFLINSVGLAQHAFLVKSLMVKERAKIEITAFIVSALVGIILALYGYKYWSITFQNVTYIMLSVLIRWFSTPWKPSLHIHFAPLKKMFSFSIKLFFTSIFNKIVDNLFTVLFGKYYNPEQVGYYNQGNKWAMMGSSFITGMISSIALPVFTQMTNDKARQKNAFRKILRFGAFISFPLMLGLAFIGKEFLILAGGGDKWIPATPFLQLFCLWNAFLYIWSLYTNIIMSHGKSNIFMWGSILTGTIQLIVIATTFHLGILQSVSAYIFIYFLGFFFWHYFTHKLIGLRILEVLKDILPYFMVTIGSILVSWFITRNIDYFFLRLFLKIVITAFLYLVIMWKSNSVIMRDCYHYFKHKNIF